MTTFTYDSNMASRSVFITTDDGRQAQIVQIRGETTLYFVPHVNGQWSPLWTPIDDPERIAPNPAHLPADRPSDYKRGLMAFAQAYAEGAGSPPDPLAKVTTTSPAPVGPRSHDDARRPSR